MRINWMGGASIISLNHRHTASEPLIALECAGRFFEQLPSIGFEQYSN
jgi:hypothetical protein